MEKGRIFEIDLLRVIAIILMISFHLVFDLKEFAGININYEAPLWYTIGKVAALLFIFVSGISCGLGRNPYKRGVRVFLYGMIITIATYFFAKEEYIRFGILHFLGVSMMLYPLIEKLKRWQLLILSFLCIIMGIEFSRMIVNTFVFIPLGLMYNGFETFDYYPIFPYISVFILGIVAYKSIYINRTSMFKFYYESKIISFISRNSLKIYLIHQPILLGIIYIVKYLNK